MIQAATEVSLPSFSHLSTSAKQTDLKACPDDSSALLAADTWTRGCLGWEKKKKKGKHWGVAGPPDLCDRRRVIPHFVMFN